MIIGQKKDQTQKFLSDGRRIPVTQIWCNGNVVVSVKSREKDGYDALQVGLGTRKKANRPMLGHIKGAKKELAPRFLREIRLENAFDDMPIVGSTIKVSDVLKPGDLVDVIGVSKGKGFAGGVKRHHFKGGPRTHGQSDRERAPGSIGQTTTPGRVYKGKRMAGRMGHDRVTVKNLEVVIVTDDGVMIKGLVPGIKGNMVLIQKTGVDNNKFVPLIEEEMREKKEKEAQAQTPVQEETPEPQEAPAEVQTEEAVSSETQEEVKKSENEKEEAENAN